MEKVKVQTITTTLTKVTRANDRITYYDLSFDKETNLRVIPGQFVMLIMPHDPRPILRAYSIASTPAEIAEGVIKLCITAVEGGKVSNWMHNKQEGDKIEVKVPYGKFVLPEIHPEQIHFVSVGTGIVPFRSMIVDLFENGCDTEIYLYHGNRHDDSILYDEEFKAIAEKHSNFHYFPCISRPTDAWKGDTGYVQNKLKEVVKSSGNNSFFICGVNAMIETVCEHLNSIGYTDDQVHFEKYD